MTQAIKAYREITVSPQFRELERLRADARNNEASALANAQRKGIVIGEKQADEKWQDIVVDKDAEIADKDAALAGKDAEIADKDAEIARLRAMLGETKQ